MKTSLLFVRVSLCSLMLAGPASLLGQTLSELEVLLCNPLLRQLEAPDVWQAARLTGVRGIEIHVESDLSCPYLHVGDTKPYRLDSEVSAQQLKEDALAHGLRTPVLVAPLRLEPEQARKGAPEWALTLIRIAPEVGAELIYFPLVTDAFARPTYSDEVFVEAAVFALNDLVREGDRRGVAIGIENLSVYWNRPEVMDQVLGQFETDELGLCLDPINLYWFGHPLSDVYELVSRYLPRARHFHAKNVAHPAEMRNVRRDPGWKYGEHSVAVDEGDLDFEKLIGMLVQSGYRGYISVEDDSLRRLPVEKRAETLRRDVDYLRALIARAEQSR